MTRVAILNSRQSKTPVGNDPWVKATLSAVEHAASNGWTIVSSIGLNTWELVTWAAGRHNAKLILICPNDMSEEFRTDLLRRFDLNPTNIEWRLVGRGEGRSTIKNWWENRDSEILSSVDVVLPVSIRKGGRLGTAINSRSGLTIDERFCVAYKPEAHHDTNSISADKLNPVLRHWTDEWLIHWTRACHGPWPGEIEAEYYSDMIRTTDAYCRSGLETIRRILNEKTIRASSWRIGAGVPIVAFTELSPVESIQVMRWRPRWSRWSFEPYGIAVRRDAAETIGVRPVRYVDPDEWKRVPDDEKCFTHSRGKRADVWSAEREWRCVGDVDLGKLAEGDVQVIVRSQSEIPEIASTISSNVLALEGA